MQCSKELGTFEKDFQVECTVMEALSPMLVVSSTAEKTSCLNERRSTLVALTEMGGAALSLTKKCECGCTLKIPDELAGKLVKCPRCSKTVKVTKSSSAIRATCSCGQRLNAKRSLAGKQVKCPACGGLLTVPGGPETQDDPFLDAPGFGIPSSGAPTGGAGDYWSAATAAASPAEPAKIEGPKKKSSSKKIPTNGIVLAGVIAFSLFAAMVLLMIGSTGGLLLLLAIINVLLFFGCLASWIWILLLSFGNEELIWTVGILFIPFVALIYGFLNFEDAKIPTLVLASSVAFSVVTNLILPSILIALR